jgi:hypothetical protein
MSDHNVYLYAIGDSALADSGALAEVKGVDDVPVRTIVEGTLAAVVASVDRDRFSENAIREHMEDLEWLGKLARVHHEVVDRLAQNHPVAPVRMATVYLGDAGVRELLENRHAELAATLDRVRSRSEWGVKGYATPANDASGEEPDSSSDAPGTAYLLRRRTQRDRTARRRQDLLEAAEVVHSQLAAAAVESRRYPLQDARLSGRPEPMVLNAAYLVDDADSVQFQERVHVTSSVDLRLELTGPWAPYSFAAKVGS